MTLSPPCPRKRQRPPLGLALVAAFVASSALGQSSTPPSTPAPAKEEPRFVELDPYVVVGSRIRFGDISGPSPVSSYGRDDILGSGAMTLADFLNSLPQTYSGVSSGRASTPSELNPEFGWRTETATSPFNLALGASSVPTSATGHSGVSLRGLGSGSTLILVDGRRVARTSVGNPGTDSRQGYVDLNSIPIGMIERVELITDGASALYGADAVAGVINIVLRKNWSGTEINSSVKGAFDGGGRERSVSLVHGFSSGRLRGTFALDTYDRTALKAIDRPFSASQDHRGVLIGVNPTTGAEVFGSNYTINWGYPATVQAVSGNLAGVLDPAGNATRVALTPEGLTATPTSAGAFIGMPTVGSTPAVGLRRGNTSEYLDLIPASERIGASLRLGATLPWSMELNTTFLYTEVSGVFHGQPAVIAAANTTGLGSYATVVPAAYNPFNQNISVGMIAHEFGSIRQHTGSESTNLTATLSGILGETWRWELAAGWQRQDFTRLTRDFNTALITAALANPDPAQRINPFIDARADGAPDQSALWEQLARYLTFDGTSELRNLDLTLDGKLFRLPGGAIGAAVGATYEETAISTTAVTPSVAVTPVVTTTRTDGQRDAKAVFAEVSVPLFGKDNALPLLDRLDLQLAARYEDQGEAGSATVPKVGITWVPLKPLLLRGGYAEGFRAPGITETQASLNNFSTSSIVDPRRGNTVPTGVQVTRAPNPDLKPETSENTFVGIVFKPDWVPGLDLQATLYRTLQSDIIQVLTEQILVNNEASFPDRVVRADPTPEDIAAGYPGRILSVDRSLLNFGTALNHSLDLGVEYRLPETSWGKWRTTFNATRTLRSRREVTPGVAAIDDVGDTFSPPKWRLSGTLQWSREAWSAGISANYLSDFTSNLSGNVPTAQRAFMSTPAQVVVDLRFGYELQRDLFFKLGQGARFTLGIGNVFDEEPAFANTPFGYNGALHSPLGRTYQIAFSLPL